MARSTQAFDADHTRISALPSDLSSQASAMQSLPVEAIRESTFLGPADLLSSDSGLFEDVLSTIGSTVPATPEPRQPLSEDGRPAGFSGQNFVETGPTPVSTESAGLPARDIRNPPARGEQEGADLDGVPQISGVKSPEKPFYMGLVDVPGIGFANTIFSRNSSGEFDPTRGATEALLAQPLSEPDTSQPKALTPAVVRLNVNPKDIVLTYSKKVSAQRVRGNYFRREIASVTGFTVEHHWDELDVVSINCTTGNFWVNGGLHYPRGESGRAGFQSASRSKSLAYRKLQAVMAMFRNNGCGWLTGATTLRTKEEAEFFGKDFNIVVNPGSAFMMYDNIIWYGNFETMKVNERGDNPNSFDFSIDFKVARTVDLNGVSEADVLVGAERGGESFFTDSSQSGGRQLVTGSVDAELTRTQDAILARQELERQSRENAASLLLPEGVEGPPMSPEMVDRISREKAADDVINAVDRAQGG